MYTQLKNYKEKEVSRFSSPYEQQMAEKPISVRLSAEIDEKVRALPNRTEWLREAIAEKLEREQNNNCA